jgi:hypothetical protein
MFHLAGDLLHPERVGRPVKNADCCGVSAERGTRKGIYQMQLMTHERRIVFRILIAIQAPGTKERIVPDGIFITRNLFKTGVQIKGQGNQ